jgi:hypothetical protein
MKKQKRLSQTSSAAEIVESFHDAVERRLGSFHYHYLYSRHKADVPFVTIPNFENSGDQIYVSKLIRHIGCHW